MTALAPAPGPENPEKGENPVAAGNKAEFLPFSPFSGPGAAQTSALLGSAAAALATMRGHMGQALSQPPGKPPKVARGASRLAPGPLLPPGEPLLPARVGLVGAPTPLPGVPPSWCKGVALLAVLPAPATVTPARWAALAATSHRLLNGHGAALYGAGRGTLDLWGLHRTAPDASPPGWGLAWLLGAAGEVMDVGPDAVGMRSTPSGARLTFWRGTATAQGGFVLAWTLGRG